MLQNRCDTHTHTLFSRHAYSTLEENVRAAASADLELLGVADHFSAMIAPSLDYRDFQHFGNESVWPRTWMGVTLLRSAEVDIEGLDGTLFGSDVQVDTGLGGNAMAPRSLLGLCCRNSDYLVASVHNRGLARQATPREGTHMYVGALEHPKVLMLGHIGRAGVPFEVRALVRAAKELHKLIEVNEHSFALAGDPWFGGGVAQACREVALCCAEEGVPVAVNTDAHISCQVGHVPQALAMLEDIHFPQALVATTDRQSFLAAVERGVGPVSGC